MKKMLFLSVSVLFLLSGCSKVNMENYSKIKSGMSYEEITSILGKATSCHETLGINSCIWGDDKSNIRVQFVADKATLFSNNNIK